MSDKKLTFELTEEESERYFSWARTLTAALLDEDCEPPSVTFTFESCMGFTEITAHYCGQSLLIRKGY